MTSITLINYDNHTGLLYVGGVAFTKEMVERVKALINAKTDQFEYDVVIYDNINCSKITVDSKILDSIETYVSKLPDGIASDNDFNENTSDHSFVVDVNKEKFIDELLDRLYINGSKEGGNYTLTLSQATTAANEVWDEFMKQK